MEKKEILTDVIVVGGGGAGLRAAVTAAEEGVEVIILEKNNTLKGGCTATAVSDWMAYGAAFGDANPQDSPEMHFYDTIVKGSYTLFPELTKEIAYNSPKRLLELEEWGANFAKTDDGKFVQILSDGATFPRACGSGVYTGMEIMKALLNRMNDFKNINVIDNFIVVDLILNEKKEVIGVYGYQRGNKNILVKIYAKAVIIASGGAGEIFANNVFPTCMDGDGYAIAYRAGAELVNMEFIQIGPCIVKPFKFALSGVFWRLNPKLVNSKGEEFLSNYIPSDVDIEKALYIKGVSFPFTIRNESFYVDIAVFNEILKGNVGKNNGIYLDISHNDSSIIEKRAKVPFEYLLKCGIDIRKEPIEFVPAIQHFNGGILINKDGESSVTGLYACGEVSGGYHGADRPGGDALAASQVFGYNAGKSAASFVKNSKKENINDKINVKVLEKDFNDKNLFEQKIKELKTKMYNYASLIRNKKDILEVLNNINQELTIINDKIFFDEVFLKYRNLLTVSKIVLKNIMARNESRGVHYRQDCECVRESFTGVFSQQKNEDVKFYDLANNKVIQIIKEKHKIESIFKIVM